MDFDFSHVDQLSNLVQELAAELPASREQTVEQLLETIEKLRCDAQSVQDEAAVLARSQAEAIVNAAQLMSDLEEAKEDLEQKNVELEKTNAELEIARDEANRAAEAKSEFLANMSHEIRTPMTAILGYADMIYEDESFRAEPDQVLDAIKTIRKSGNHLLQLINDILDVSKMEAGRMEIEALPVEPIQIVEEVASLMRPRVMEANLQLHVEYTGLLPQTIKADPTRLRQILTNLISNAIKFTSEGSVTIRTQHLPDEQQIAFSVEDTGIGMSVEQCELISQFKPFTQADSSITRRFGGTGLGLRISHTLSHCMGGKLAVTSEQGVGSTFTAMIATGDMTHTELIDPLQPKKEVHAAKTNAAAQDSKKDMLKGKRILLAEDGPENQMIFEIMLTSAGAEVFLVENGKAAVEAITSHAEGHFDIILMDMHMPEMDGYSATRALRDSGCALPIVALTAQVMRSEKAQCIESGCNDHIAKPVNRDALLRACRKWIYKQLSPAAV